MNEDGGVGTENGSGYAGLETFGGREVGRSGFLPGNNGFLPNISPNTQPTDHMSMAVV